MFSGFCIVNNMKIEQIYILLFIFNVIIPFTFILKSSWLVRLHIKELEWEKRIFKTISFLHKSVKWELNFVKSKWGTWFYQAIGIIWFASAIFIVLRK
jgi:hypothetical protein